MRSLFLLLVFVCTTVVSATGCDPGQVYATICRRDAACRDLYPNVYSNDAAVAEVSRALGYFWQLGDTNRSVPFWQPLVPAATYLPRSVCDTALAAVAVSVASSTVSPAELAILDALIRFKAYLSTSSCVHPMSQLVWDETLQVGSCVCAPGQVCTVSTTTDSLGLATAITSLVLLVVAVILCIAILAQVLYHVRRLGKTVTNALLARQQQEQETPLVKLVDTGAALVRQRRTAQD